jgi:probable HAF family extracellular repeat protein
VGVYSETGAVGFADGRGFLLDRGRFTRIDFPGAVNTVARGLNDRGQVVGGYLDADGRFHGFLWDKGRFTTIDVPGAGGTTATDINNRGQIAGEFGEDPSNTPTALHGFLLSGGDFTTFDAPGVLFTEPGGINDRGQIVGSTASDRALTEVHGFLLDEGVEAPFTSIDFPGAPRTLAFDINNRRQIVGVYENPNAPPDRQPSPMRMPMTMSGGDG